MTFEEISQIAERFHYKFPVIAGNENGEQVVIQAVDIDNFTECETYRMYTYQNDGRVRVNTYSKNGENYECFE